MNSATNNGANKMETRIVMDAASFAYGIVPSSIVTCFGGYEIRINTMNGPKMYCHAIVALDKKSVTFHRNGEALVVALS